jgi:hypothetical protein
MFNDSGSGQHPIFVSHEVFQDPIFFIRECLFLPRAPYLVGDGIEFQVSDLQADGGLPTPSTEKGAHSG